MIPDSLAKLEKDPKVSFPSQKHWLLLRKKQCPISGGVVVVVGVKRENILLKWNLQHGSLTLREWMYSPPLFCILKKAHLFLALHVFPSANVDQTIFSVQQMWLLCHQDFWKIERPWANIEMKELD